MTAFDGFGTAHRCANRPCKANQPIADKTLCRRETRMAQQRVNAWRAAAECFE